VVARLTGVDSDLDPFPASPAAPPEAAAQWLEVIDRTVARLHVEEPAFDWVGVYLVQQGELVLGPFRGLPTEHVRIPLGAGVCGAVAETVRTEVVPDVRARPGHIACDVNTRSETVAPIARDGRVLGVLDVDSNTPAAFGEREVQLIEAAAAAIADASGA
jgi:putative methionine-R-sulfoxide reductase with GAF domain